MCHCHCHPWNRNLRGTHAPQLREPSAPDPRRRAWRRSPVLFARRPLVSGNRDRKGSARRHQFFFSPECGWAWRWLLSRTYQRLVRRGGVHSTQLNLLFEMFLRMFPKKRCFLESLIAPAPTTIRVNQAGKRTRTDPWRRCRLHLAEPYWGEPKLCQARRVWSMCILYFQEQRTRLKKKTAFSSQNSLRTTRHIKFSDIYMKH